MFLRIYILGVLTLFSTLNAKIYSGCGENEKIARDELAKSIYVSVSSSFEKNESLSGDDVQKDVKNWSKQSTDLKLINIDISNGENEVCAKISTEDLEKSLNGVVAQINSFNILKISTNHKEARIQLNSKITDCEMGIKISSVLGKKRVISYLNRKLQTFQNRLENIFSQSVKFNLPLHKLEIFIDGENKSYKINKDIPLKAGEHQYLIKSKKYCDISGDFILEEGEDELIEDIDLENYLYPRITFTSNKDKQYIKFTVDNKSIAIGKEYIHNRCNGELVYRAEYSDGDYEENENGKLTISAGYVKSINLDFLSIGDIKSLKNQVIPYTKGQRLEFLYSYGYVEKNNQFRKDTHNISFNMLTHKRFFRYGYGGLFGSDNLSDSSVKLIELYYQVAVQFSSFGDNNLPLRIGKYLSFIPYAGLEFGVGYHEYTYEDNKIYQYPKAGDEDAENNYEDYDAFNWKRDLLLVRPIIGVDFILSKGFALKLFGSKSLFIDGRWNIGTGLSVEF